jgi:hypothetical protein
MSMQVDPEPCAQRMSKTCLPPHLLDSPGRRRLRRIGWYYWFPKMIGYMYSETIGKLNFWVTSSELIWYFSPALFWAGRNALDASPIIPTPFPTGTELHRVD